MQQRPSPTFFLGLIGLAFGLASGAFAQTRYHVDDDAGPGGDGLSWGTAFAFPEQAMDAVVPGDKVWVAEGKYVPRRRRDPADPRTASFEIPQGTKWYGGFDGTETSFKQRAGRFDQTRFSGDLGVPGDASDNCYTVVFVRHPDGPPPGATRLDGFRITRGNADGDLAERAGGGVRSFNSALSLTNCRIEHNRAIIGGGIHAQVGILNVRWCRVENNRAIKNGGGLWAQAIALRISNDVFAGNSAAEKGGGAYLHAMYADLDSAVFAGVVLRDNSALVGGGAYVGGSEFSAGTAAWRNCTFAYNRALLKGGALRAVTGTKVKALTRLDNCIVWGNQALQGSGVLGRAQVTYSTVQGGYPGEGNLALDPLFRDAGERDLRLSPGSLCIDAGHNGRVGADVADVDFDGDKNEVLPLDAGRARRFEDDPLTPDTGVGSAPIVDLGAYEGS